MPYLMRILLIIAEVLMLPGLAAAEELGPSEGAVHMPGAKGVFAFRPVDWHAHEKSWWKDTDGVAPGVAGCHVGVSADGEPNGRTFGEACLADRILVESNPGKGLVHSHNDDTGFPDMFNCHNWCMKKTGTAGQCVVAVAPPCATSARCLCDVELQMHSTEPLIEATNRHSH